MAGGRVGPWLMAIGTLTVLVLGLTDATLFSVGGFPSPERLARDMLAGDVTAGDLDAAFKGSGTPVMTWLAMQVVRTSPVVWGGLALWVTVRDRPTGPMIIVARLVVVAAALALAVVAVRTLMPVGDSALARALRDLLGGAQDRTFVIEPAGWAHLSGLLALLVGGAMEATAGAPLWRAGRRGGGTGTVRTDG